LNLIILVYASFFLFLWGLFALTYFKGLVRILWSLQIIIFSAVINFLVFSYFLYQGSLWDKTFLMLGLIPVYMLLFMILFYAYTLWERDKAEVWQQLNFWEWGFSAWWGEDKS